MARCSGSLWGRLWDVRALTCCSRLGVEILKPLVLVVRGLKNTVGECKVGVCKLGCALGIHDDKCVVFSVASYSVLVGQIPLVSYGM